MNTATVIVILGIVSAVLGAVVALRKRKVSGSTGCSGDCESCAMSGVCRK